MANGRGKVYNKIYNETDWNNVNKENKYVMNDYLEEYKQRKKKPSTIKQYHNDLRIILIYILHNCENKSIFELKKKDFRRMNLWMAEKNMSNARINRLMSSVRSLLTYCEDDDEYDYEINYAQKVKGLPKEPIRVDEDAFFFDYETVMKVREKLLERNEIQLATLHMILFDSGGRRNEVHQILKKGLLDGNKTNIVTGKRGKTFPLVYLNDTKELIKQYLEERGEDDIDKLFVIGKSEKKRPMSYEVVYDKVVKISSVFSEVLDKEVYIFPHSYRHSRCECLLQGEDPRIIDPKTGKPKKFTLEEVQLFLHHSDPKTTQGYAKDHTEEIIDNMFNFS